jgi:hypothetical protein
MQLSDTAATLRGHHGYPCFWQQELAPQLLIQLSFF